MSDPVLDRKPKFLVYSFVSSSVATIAGLIGLIVSPVFASAELVAILFAVSGLAAGITAMIIKRAA